MDGPRHVGEHRPVSPVSPSLFLSYRRDDAAGYAGRLEEALERRAGRGIVFRDVQDMQPGEDFVQAIRRRLADAHTVLVLIGPRWAGPRPDGGRRLDDADDFVRLEVQAALESGARVLPVLLPGATMPAEAELPKPLRALARRHALTLSDTHWAADVERLAGACGLARTRPVWPWAAGGALLAAAAVAVLCSWRGGGDLAAAPAASSAAADFAPRILGRWQAELRYHWSGPYTETFEFQRHAGAVVGTASYGAYPRVIENLQFDGTNLRFETRTEESMGNERRTKTHAYAAELRGSGPDAVLVFRLQTTGGFDSPRPLQFEARRVAATPAASAPVGSASVGSGPGVGR